MSRPIRLVIPATLRAIALAGYEFEQNDRNVAIKEAALEAAVRVVIDGLDESTYCYLLTHAQCTGYRPEDRVVRVVALLATDRDDREDFGLEAVEVIYEDEQKEVQPREEP